MTHRHDLERRRHSLAEIRDIMNSMKTLSYMETRKLSRFLDSQRAVVQNIEYAAADLIHFHPDILPEEQETRSVHLLIGTERGFCGDFNQALLQQLTYLSIDHTSSDPLWIVLGRKLGLLLEGNTNVVSFLDGASVTEEVGSVLNQLVSELNALQDKHGVVNLFCLYHGGEDGITVQKLLPPFQSLSHVPPSYSTPPVLNLSPRKLMIELSDQYLFAILHEILFMSLMAESRRRVTHLETAVKHLDEDAEELSHRCNALRQEEIIEEMEVILLNAAGA